MLFFLQKKFNFSKIIKSDKVVSNYGYHTDIIYSEIINSNDVLIVSRLGQVRVFLVIVLVGDGTINILHHIQPSSTNFFTKKATNIKVIISLTDKGSLTEIKNLHIEELSKGKVPHLDKLLKVTEDLDMK